MMMIDKESITHVKSTIEVTLELAITGEDAASQKKLLQQALNYTKTDCTDIAKTGYEEQLLGFGSVY